MALQCYDVIKRFIEDKAKLLKQRRLLLRRSRERQGEGSIPVKVRKTQVQGEAKQTARQEI